MTTAITEERPDAGGLGRTEAPPRPFHWTADAYHRAAEAGAFGHDARLELIHGRIIDRMPVSPTHAEVADYLADCLRAVVSARLKVREEKPIRIDFDGEPIPDITVVRRAPQRYLAQHPSPEDVELLVEVAISSEEYDLGEKALLYAQASIPDYWVVLPGESAIVVHRNPSADGYGQITRLGADGTVSPLAAPGASLPVRSLLGL